MIIERLVVGMIETNCYIVGCPETKAGMVIDPGADGRRILSRIETLGLELKWIVNTHAHVDHISANKRLKEVVPEAQLAMHPEAAQRVTDPKLNLSAAFGIPVTSPPADRLLSDGDELTFGDVKFAVLCVPGHTPGCIALYAADETPPVVFSGDALFAGSIGRTDLGGGSHPQLLQSIRDRLLTLPAETVV